MSALEDTAIAAALLAVDPAGLGGVCLRSAAQPSRERWLELLRDSLKAGTPWRRIPSNIADDRLLGDIDLVATLKAGRPLPQPGVLESVHGGVLVIAMAERLSTHTASLLNEVIDSGRVCVPRSGVTLAYDVRMGVVALDESTPDEAGLAASLLDRLGIIVDLHALDPRREISCPHDRESVAAARKLLPRVRVDAKLIEALCSTAAALGSRSLRVAWLAFRAAAAAAALAGRRAAAIEDAELAARLVLAPRATRSPSQEPSASAQDARKDSAADATELNGGDGATQERPAEAAEAHAERTPEPVDSRVLAAAAAAIPRGLLLSLESSAKAPARAQSSGRMGALRLAARRGRPVGCRPASGRGRIHVIETLRAAAPWQSLRAGASGRRVHIARQDLREQRFKMHSPTLTIFVVDASGSAALNRLAEAKGAVELMLAECYIRRDLVAVVAFRNTSAELVLPPTRSLVRAKRCLAGLPGGGGTPLAAALASAASLSVQSRRRGETPTIVVLSDGRANIARNGAPGRAGAHADALVTARLIRESQAPSVFIDSSPKPNPLAQELARAMRARYVALPYPAAHNLSRLVQPVV